MRFHDKTVLLSSILYDVLYITQHASRVCEPYLRCVRRDETIRTLPLDETMRHTGPSVPLQRQKRCLQSHYVPFLHQLPI
jgi:hypothetical protein